MYTKRKSQPRTTDLQDNQHKHTTDYRLLEGRKNEKQVQDKKIDGIINIYLKKPSKNTIIMLYQHKEMLYTEHAVPTLTSIEHQFTYHFLPVHYLSP